VIKLHDWSSVVQQMSLVGKGKIKSSRKFLRTSVVVEIFVVFGMGGGQVVRKVWCFRLCTVQLVLNYPGFVSLYCEVIKCHLIFRVDYIVVIPAKNMP